jgi:hypothetical protein
MEMGGMFSVVRVREGLAANDYKDPGPYKHPPGTVAYEFKGDPGPPPRRSEAPAPPASVDLKVVKPGNSSGHHH